MALTAEDERPVLDKYEVAEEIGHGGMATVYRARDRRLDRDVAIKVIHRHLRENTEVAARFVSEARAVAKLKHPNIVEVYDVSDEADPERYLVVELVRGTTLRRLLHTHGHMPAEIAAAVTIEIAEGLEHAHEHGVIHRDVKPENVLVEPPSGVAGRKESQERTAEQQRARIKITDFGIAKLLDVQGVTSTGQVLGSPAHMAPEQIEGGDVTVRSDVFGLGVLLYECCVGKLPFDGKNPAQVLRRVLDGKYVPAERARPTVGAAFSKIIDRALARESDDRFATVTDFIAALRGELARSHFEHPERDVADYLTDPAAYVTSYEPRIVEHLIATAQQARKERDTALAAACFNRALAFRPDDADLLRHVAGLARAQRLRRAGVRVAAIVTGSALLGALAYAGVRVVKNAVPARPNRDAKAARVTPKVEPRASARVAPSASAQEETDAARARARPTHVRPVEEKKRKVIIDPNLDSNPTVFIDQVPYDWPYKVVELSVGPHSVRIDPPNKTCCEPYNKTVTVDEGEREQRLRLDVKLKDATVTFNGEPGSSARCPDLPDPSLTPGESESRPMTVTDFPIRCTVTPASGEPFEQKVKLRPGQTVTLSDSK